MAKQRMPLWTGVAVVLIGFLLVTSACQSSFVRPLWKAVGFIGQPESYTAISFANPRSLPTQLTAKQTSLKVTFVISNATPGEELYSWTVSVAEATVFRYETTGKISVAAGKVANISHVVKLRCKPGQVKLTVSLAHPKEHIDAMINCTS